MKNLENQLRQRINSVEHTLSKIAFIKQNVKSNSEAIRKEVRRSFSQQLCYLRQREQQLLEQLDAIVSSKDLYLGLQEQSLNSSLALYQDGLKKLVSAAELNSTTTTTVPTSNSEVQEVSDMLTGFSLLDLEPCETANLSFDANHNSLRKSIFLFGEIKMSKHSKLADSLPCEFEDYEDDDVLHSLLQSADFPKSDTIIVHRSKPVVDKHNIILKAFTEKSNKPQLKFVDVVDSSCTTHSVLSHERRQDHVHNWLHHIKHGTEGEPTICESEIIIKKVGEDEQSPNEVAEVLKHEGIGDESLKGMEEKLSTADSSFEIISDNTASSAAIVSIQQECKSGYIDFESRSTVTIRRSCDSKWLKRRIDSNDSSWNTSANFVVKQVIREAENSMECGEDTEEWLMDTDAFQLNRSDCVRNDRLRKDRSAALIRHRQNIWQSDNRLWLNATPPPVMMDSQL
ncbi:Nuclear receptor coactivator [Trichinella spiralis]|uniref:Nuclear receptor coactivator n=1 Tax=Trichinella spiralis TaxID=6334 RepID=A0ABR3KR46_TRISP